MPLYNVKNPLTDASRSSNNAMQGYSALAGMRPPPKTAGGALMSALGGAGMGTAIASKLGIAGPWGLAAGAGTAALSYLFS